MVTDEDIQRALAVQQMGGGRLGAILVNLRLCTDEQIRRALSEQLDDVEVVKLDEHMPTSATLDLLPRELIQRYEAIPLSRDGSTIQVAMLDPYNLTAIDDIKFATGCSRVRILTCTEGDFRAFIEENLSTQTLIQEILDGGRFYDKAVKSLETEREAPESDEADESQETVHDLKLAGEQPPIITLCNFLLVESIVRKASDIHIEPYETYFRVRLRIDGHLQTLLTPPQRLHTPMIARCKIMAGMDISKRRIPQDGHIAIVYEGETCHYRVSTLPTVFGEKCVIRLLKKDASLTDINRLGFSSKELVSLKQGLARPQGMILVTGPTGTGKTTTLHAALDAINEVGTNIVTLEDPVEASIPGINHVEINDAAGLTFSAALRSVLRQDPNVVFVGEMRDPEVSAIAVRASLTGHLVLSTLHTNSAVESLLRLTDMGLPPYLLANALVMIIAQRLVRRVCPDCKAPYVPTADEVEEFRLDSEIVQASPLVKGAGCSNCFQSGYRGRVAVYEMLEISNAMRTLIRTGAPIETILTCAESEGMQLLFHAGIRRALAGETTLDEVRRNLSDAR